MTGACSGIGYAIAHELASRGVGLVLASNDAERLREAVSQLNASFEIPIESHVGDLRDNAFVDALAEHVAEQPLDLLVNNAGMLFHGPFHDMTMEQADMLLDVNLRAPIRLTRQLMPALMRQKEAHILNVASMCGFAALPKLAVYQATKFGLLGFSESLRVDYGKLGIGVTTVCPGFVKTKLFHSAESAPNREARIPPSWLSTTPEWVAQRAIRAVERNRRLVVVTPFAHALYWLRRTFPGALDWVSHLGKRRATRKRLERVSQLSTPE